MNFAEKFKETLTSVLPIVAAVLVLHFTVAPLEKSVLVNFIVGGVLIILGLTIFLAGVDMGISPMGERSGAALTAKRNLPLLLIASFAIGLFVTIAEPDVQVLVDQVKGIAPWVSKWGMVVMIAIGVGLFVSAGILRTILSLPLKPFLFVFYVGVFLLAAFTASEFQGISFDSGGATTGPMTVPFIMALGLGVAAVRSTSSGKGEKDSTDDDSFGLTGVASIGPIAAVCLYGILFSGAGEATGSATEIVGHSFLAGIFSEVALALAPLAAMFFVFQFFLLKMPPMQVVKMVRGLVFSFIGLVLFLAGAKSGFMDAGAEVGRILGLAAATTKGQVILYIVALVFGAIVVCAEPAVWVLTEQVENVSGGTIKRKMLLISLSAGVAISIALSMLRILKGFSIFYILIPGYALAFLLMIFCPKLFTGIAFDSGGVASGPMTSTFILSFALGVSGSISGAASADSAFGIIALVAMTPLVAIQILGILFMLKQRQTQKRSSVRSEREQANE